MGFLDSVGWGIEKVLEGVLITSVKEQGPIKELCPRQ